MFFTLLLITLVVAALVSFIAVRAFSSAINSILHRLIDDAIASAWVRYMKFAIFVWGYFWRCACPFAGALYFAARTFQSRRRIRDMPPFELTTERWCSRYIARFIESLQSIAWMLLVIFYCVTRYVHCRAYF